MRLSSIGSQRSSPPLRKRERGPEIEANGSIDLIRLFREENFQQSSAYIGYTILIRLKDSIR
ncbi:MAG: hypothetical protein IPL01_18340 [Acidobacteria bacterium]|nr:hypothetical protein [Acidobacteriota bacterium]